MTGLRYYHADGLGSTRLLTDDTAAITDHLTYEAFGELDAAASLQTGDNAFMFTGEQWDPNAGFYYLRARYMNPSNGRFTQQDSFLGVESSPITIHKYSYANLSPALWRDPSGHVGTTEQSIASSIQSSMTTTLRVAGGALNIYQRTQTFADFVQLGYDIGRVFTTGGAIDGIVLSFAGRPRDVSPWDAVEKFVWNGMRAVGQGAMNWASGYVRSSQNKAFKSFLIYMPNPPPGTGFYTEVQTPIKIAFTVAGRRKMIPVKLVFGAPKGAYGQLMGIGMAMGKNRQLYRMDMHGWHDDRGGGTGVKSGEIAAWKDSADERFHYHVMKWTGE